MDRIANFEKVPYEQYREDLIKVYGSEDSIRATHIISPCEDVDVFIKSRYDEIKLPERASTGSAGYDFFMPIMKSIEPGKTVVIPTGIRVKMDEGWVLTIFPRSGLGCKYRVQLDNTVGIIDSDYYKSDNYGHIHIKITNDSKEDKTCVIPAGSGFAQGIFLPFGITVDDNVTNIRNGGFGSTTK